MGAFSPPWPPTLLGPIEYGAFWRVPGPQKAKKHYIPPILGNMRKFLDFQLFYPKMLIFGDFSLFGVQGPSKRLHIPLVLEGLEAMGAKGHPFHQNGVNLINFN